LRTSAQGDTRRISAILSMRVRPARSRSVLDLTPVPPRLRVTPSSADDLSDQKGLGVKGSQKPKKLAKKPAQKTLKERRTAKRAAAKQAGRGLDV
jgi:hypothetical protein